MRRYWIQSQHINDTEVSIREESFHHIVDVCRQGLGSKFEILSESREALFVEIFELQKKSARARILERRPIAPLPKPHLHLALAVPRFHVLDSVLEKTVELGVSSIQLVFSDNSFVRKDTKISPQKMERWSKIILSSTQQCGRGELMKLKDPIGLEEFLKGNNASSFNLNEPNESLFAYEGPGQVTIHDYLERVGTKAPDDFWLFVGSEGGFSDREVALFQNSGLKPVSLGAQILRVETACLTLVSVIKYHFRV